MTDNITYSMHGDAVRIHNMTIGEAVNVSSPPMSRSNIMMAIAAVNANKAEFSTDAAFERQLSMFQGALDFLDACEASK